MSGEQPYKISVPDEDIAILKRKLELCRFPDELEEAGRDYGAPLVDIKRLVTRWKEGYDWRIHESKLNELPMFTRDIEVDGFGTLDIHYVHKKSDVENAIPLLFIHGWPGSFIEATKILPLLTQASSNHPSFHVVTFSLPGFGFSEAPRKKGFAGAQYTEVGNKLMLALGYNEYVTQGGDWGAIISRYMAATIGPKHVKAWHANMPSFGRPSFWSSPLHLITLALKPYSKEERAGLERTKWFLEKEMGYFKEQTTQPQTIGYSLADSPIGLLAWIYEKLVKWTDNYQWTDDEVLTWISIYWFSRAGPAASVRIYYEMLKAGHFESTQRPSIPHGFSYFPKELAVVPKVLVRASAKVVFESSHERGGHFAAFEMPEELVDDLRRMFAKGGPAYGVVPNKSGYSN